MTRTSDADDSGVVTITCQEYMRMAELIKRQRAELDHLAAQVSSALGDEKTEAASVRSAPASGESPEPFRWELPMWCEEHGQAARFGEPDADGYRMVSFDDYAGYYLPDGSFSFQCVNSAIRLRNGVMPGTVAQSATVEPPPPKRFELPDMPSMRSTPGTGAISETLAALEAIEAHLNGESV